MSKIKRFLPAIFSGALALFFSGCTETVTNLTPHSMPQNPSGRYTLSMSTRFNEAELVPGSVKPRIVIDGKEMPMEPSPMGKYTYDFDYKMPRDQREANYYFVLDYQVEHDKATRDRKKVSDLQHLKVTNRYVISLESDRAPVGASIPVVGRGFTRFDKILVGNQEADTTFHSANSLSFTVPALEAGENYMVELESTNGNIPIGNFHVDPSQVRIVSKDMAPNGKLTIKENERTQLIFTIDNDAPSQGLLVEVTTDVPDSIIMPEVNIPAGARTVNIPLQGGEMGTGNLFVNAAGFDETVIPITIERSS